MGNSTSWCERKYFVPYNDEIMGQAVVHFQVHILYTKIRLTATVHNT
jgi:hypothetical protein